VLFLISFCFLNFYLMILSALRLYSIDDRMINVCGAIGEMRIGKGIEVLRENFPNVTLSTTNLT
jgi:hypothetical protein